MTEQIRCGHATNVGRVREHNEDSYALEPESGLWVVADGMGGHAGGEIASEITVRTVCERIRDGQTLKQAVLDAHAAVIEAGLNGVGKSGMGSTLVALRILEDRFHIAWVGDSRVYLWNGESFQQVTRDHSYVQLLLDNHVIQKHEVREHPMRHIVNQAIGNSANGEIIVDTVSGETRNGYRFLLCSDGLTDEVSDDRIGNAVGSENSVQDVADSLVEMALDSGGTDNITVLVVESVV